MRLKIFSKLGFDWRNALIFQDATHKARKIWMAVILFFAVCAVSAYWAFPSSGLILQPQSQAMLFQLKKSEDVQSAEDIELLKGGRAVQLPFFEPRPEGSSLVHFAHTLTFHIMDSTETVVSLGEMNDRATHGLLFIQIYSGGNFFLNGTWVAGLPGSNMLDRWIWYRPLLVPLPKHLLNTNGKPNVMTIVQSSYEPFLIIGRPYLGPIAHLRKVYEVTNLLSTLLANTARLMCIALGIFMLLAWRVSPKDKIFALAGLTTILAAFFFSLSYWSYLPIHLHRVWRIVVFLSTGGMVAMMSLFVLAYIGEPLAKRETWLFLGYASLGPLVYAVGGPSTENFLNNVWTSLLGLVYLYSCVRLTIYVMKTRQLRSVALLVQSIFCFFLGYHDFAVLSGLFADLVPTGLQWSWWTLLIEPIYLLNLGIPLLCFVMGYTLLMQYRTQAKSVTFANQHLQSSLQQREKELRQSHEQQKKLALMEATRAERDRIYQDVQDGIGLRLVSAMFSLRQGNANAKTVEEHLKGCMSDLRLIINVHSDEESDIQSAVFEHCLTQESLLEVNNITLSYDVGDDPPLRLAPQHHLNILRILQEAITNAIKHAGASEINVKLEIFKNELRLSIVDNGKLDTGQEEGADLVNFLSKGKRGLAGMSERAKAVSGSFSFRRIKNETHAQVQIPLITSYP
jgi:signal transduction histidine kinase